LGTVAVAARACKPRYSDGREAVLSDFTCASTPSVDAGRPELSEKGM
jgi:hypothetical protein